MASIAADISATVTVSIHDGKPTVSINDGEPTSSAYDVHQDIDEVLFTQSQLSDRIGELGRQIAQDYAGLRPIVMPILKGGFIVAADLVRSLDPCPAGMEVEFVSARSYGARTETSGTVQVAFEAAGIANRHVLLVDDLCDSGLTLQTVRDRVLAAGAASVKSCVALDKRSRRKVQFECDYVGFLCPDAWVAGLGMDTNQLYRSLGYVGTLKPEAIKRALGK